MTTEELVKQLNANGWTNSNLITEEKGQDYISICAPFNDEVMEIPVDATNWLNIKLDYFEARDGLTGAVREYVSSLVTQYLNTPVSKRKTEKKYRLRWIDGEDDNPRKKTYLGMNDTGFFNGSCWATYLKSSAPTFTESQLKKLKRDNPRFAPAIDVMKEEVKDDAR